jgi:hypothetical protein
MALPERRGALPKEPVPPATEPTVCAACGRRSVLYNPINADVGCHMEGCREREGDVDARRAHVMGFYEQIEGIKQSGNRDRAEDEAVQQFIADLHLVGGILVGGAAWLVRGFVREWERGQNPQGWRRPR